MGWLFSCDPSFKRADQVAKFRQPGYWNEGTKLLADRVVGNHYWAAIETPKGEKFVFLALMQGGGRDMGWGYKDMTEHCGPYHHDCPLSLLEMTDEPTEGYAVEWRKRVREFHANKKAKPVRGPGDKFSINGTVYELVEKRAPRQGWRVKDEYGTPYRISFRALSHATWED